MTQPPLLLHKRPVPAYTRNPQHAMPGEPEALTPQDLALITQAAHDRELRTWRTSRRRLLTEIEHLRTQLHNPHVARAARALEREINALDHKLSTSA